VQRFGVFRRFSIVSATHYVISLNKNKFRSPKNFSHLLFVMSSQVHFYSDFNSIPEKRSRLS
jgi:hypothetical protein